jgi:hypothetical protein
MDLSKIPEPSEEDLQWTREGLSNFHSNYEDPKKDLRVIAHLLRHGSVLAKQSDPKNNHRTFTMGQIAEMEKRRLEAVKVFLKFGGDDER